MAADRTRKTHTFSISVDDETRRILKEEAARSFDGNVSALVSAIAKEATRRAARQRLMALFEQPPVSDAERKAFLSELDPRPSRRRAKKAA